MNDEGDTANPARARHTGRWFPVAFEEDLDPGAPTRVTIHGRGHVLFRCEGAWRALPDRCPHRAARLSDGRVVDGGIECLYHGWTFGCDGACTRIPQLQAGGAIPPPASLRPTPLEVVQGMVWLFDGAAEEADPARIRRIAALDEPGVHRIDYATDLPYGQAALIENVLDFAHIHIAHDGARGGGHRPHAGPLAFDVEDRGAAGFLARFKSTSKGPDGSGARPTGAFAEFDAPNLVHYATSYGDDRTVSGLALFSVPLAPDRCRLLYRAYGNAWPARDVARPRWREHLFQMELLEQDMAVVTGQVAELAADPRPLREAWLPIRSSDQLVVEHRRWVDAHGGGTGERGWTARSDAIEAGTGARPELRREVLHTRICSACRTALARARGTRRWSAVAASAGLLAAALLPGPWAFVAAALALGAGGLRVRAGRHIELLTRGPRR